MTLICIDKVIINALQIIRTNKLILNDNRYNVISIDKY